MLPCFGSCSCSGCLRRRRLLASLAHSQTSHRFQIEEVVEFIKGKLQELDAEKAELAAFQVRG
jgi:hypothetical protein